MPIEKMWANSVRARNPRWPPEIQSYLNMKLSFQWFGLQSCIVHAFCVFLFWVEEFIFDVHFMI